RADDEAHMEWICPVGPCKSLVCSQAMTLLPNPHLKVISHVVKFYMCSGKRILVGGVLCFFDY
ncbi:hypothetical protein Ancab_021739, partial [Ancistrocladus abbreviatus]